MVEAARSKAFTSLSVTLLPLTITDRAEVVGVIQVMLLAAPAVKVVGPATVRLPLSVRAPLVVTVNVAADRGGGEIQGIHIVQRHVVAAGDHRRC